MSIRLRPLSAASASTSVSMATSSGEVVSSNGWTSAPSPSTSGRLRALRGPGEDRGRHVLQRARPRRGTGGRRSARRRPGVIGGRGSGDRPPGAGLRGSAGAASGPIPSFNGRHPAAGRPSIAPDRGSGGRAVPSRRPRAPPRSPAGRARGPSTAAGPRSSPLGPVSTPMSTGRRGPTRSRRHCSSRSTVAGALDRGHQAGASGTGADGERAGRRSRPAGPAAVPGRRGRRTGRWPAADREQVDPEVRVAALLEDGLGDVLVGPVPEELAGAAGRGSQGRGGEGEPGGAGSRPSPSSWACSRSDPSVVPGPRIAAGDAAPPPGPSLGTTRRPAATPTGRDRPPGLRPVPSMGVAGRSVVPVYRPGRLVADESIRSSVPVVPAATVGPAGPTGGADGDGRRRGSKPEASQRRTAPAAPRRARRPEPRAPPGGRGPPPRPATGRDRSRRIEEGVSDALRLAPEPPAGPVPAPLVQPGGGPTRSSAATCWPSSRCINGITVGADAEHRRHADPADTGSPPGVPPTRWACSSPSTTRRTRPPGYQVGGRRRRQRRRLQRLPRLGAAAPRSSTACRDDDARASGAVYLVFGSRAVGRRPGPRATS